MGCGGGQTEARAGKMIRWASSIGAVNTRDAPVTHVLTSGGGYLAVPDDKLDELAQQCSMHTDSSVTLSELPSDGAFPMFFKINHIEGLTKDRMLKIGSVVVGVLHQYYPEPLVGSTTFESVAYPVSSDSFGLVFSKLFVTEEKALQIRYAVVCELDAQVGSLCEHLWSDVIAREVYTTGMEMYGWARSVSCTGCSSPESIGGAEKGALKELESEYISLRRKIHPMGTGFDYGNLLNIHPAETKSRELNQLYLRLVKARGGRTCSLCLGKGVTSDKTQNEIPIIALTGSGDECIMESELLIHGDRLQVIRKTTIRAPAGWECTPGFSRPIGLPVLPPPDTADMLRLSGDLRMKRGMSASLLTEATNSDVYADDLRGMLLLNRGKQVRETDPEILGNIQRFIRIQMGNIGDTKHYAKVRVKSVDCDVVEKKVGVKSTQSILARIAIQNNTNILEAEKKRYRKKMWIRVQGEGSCFCMNRREHHEKSSIYFEMGPGVCYQRCFCSDDVVGRAHNKTCKDYSTGKARGQKLSGSLMKLFGTDDSSEIPAMPAMVYPKRKKPRPPGEGKGRGSSYF